MIENSGTTEIEDLTLEELEKKIDLKIKDAGRFYYENEKNKAILHRFSKHTFLAYREDVIQKNDTGYSDNDVKELLRHYDSTFKKPLTRMLIEYYRLKHNPDIKMEGNILERLGFRACGYCSKAEDEIKAPEASRVSQENIDLPFCRSR